MCRDYLPGYDNYYKNSQESFVEHISRIMDDVEVWKKENALKTKEKKKDADNDIEERLLRLEKILEREFRTTVIVCPKCNGDGMIADNGKL